MPNITRIPMEIYEDHVGRFIWNEVALNLNMISSFYKYFLYIFRQLICGYYILRVRVKCHFVNDRHTANQRQNG